MNRRTVCLALVAAVSALVGPGCSRTDGNSLLKDANSSNIRRLTNLYAAFAEQHSNRGPKDEKQFRDFISTMGPERLERLGVDSAAIDTIFVSERDSQPFVIKYGRVKQEVRGGGPSSKATPDVAVVLEAKGLSGVREVGFLGSRQVKSLDDAAVTALP